MSHRVRVLTLEDGRWTPSDELTEKFTSEDEAMEYFMAMADAGHSPELFEPGRKKLKLKWLPGPKEILDLTDI